MTPVRDRSRADGGGRREQAWYEPKALGALFECSGGYPYFVQAYGKATWDHAPRSPVTAVDVRVATPEAGSELAVGSFGPWYAQATPVGWEYPRAMAELSVADGDQVGAVVSTAAVVVPTAAVARAWGRRSASLSSARDALIKKGLIYSGGRGSVALTVPHFGRYPRAQPG